MFRRVDRGTHISLVPMPVSPNASWLPVDARSPLARLAYGVREFFARAALAEIAAYGLLLALVMLVLALVFPLAG